jgi:hypothetical protein
MQHVRANILHSMQIFCGMKATLLESIHVKKETAATETGRLARPGAHG